jgi:aminoglycoside 3-N-acetyltransferase
MLKEKLSRLITENQKRTIKSAYSRIRNFLVNHFMSYDEAMLRSALRKISISESDTVMVHANFESDSGFRGIPLDLVNALKGFFEKEGNLLMVSIPFRGYAYDYLMKMKPFRKNRTISMMGLVTETFRKTDGVIRSLHPTHPVLAFGKDSVWLVEGHEKSQFPCGAGTPYEKFRQLNGKVLFFDVGFGAITFMHYVEDMLKDKLPFKLYHDQLFTVTAYDENDIKYEIKTFAFNKNVVRNLRKLEEEMLKRDLIKTVKVGNSNLVVVNAEDVVTCMTSMVESGNLFYDDWDKEIGITS